MHKYWFILSQVEYFIAQASRCNKYCITDNICQYSCNKPFFYYLTKKLKWQDLPTLNITLFKLLMHWCNNLEYHILHFGYIWHGIYVSYTQNYVILLHWSMNMFIIYFRHKLIENEDLLLCIMFQKFFFIAFIFVPDSFFLMQCLLFNVVSNHTIWSLNIFKGDDTLIGCGM